MPGDVDAVHADKAPLYDPPDRTQGCDVSAYTLYTKVAGTHRFVGVAAAVSVKRQLDRLCKVGQVGNGLFEGEVLQILGCEGSIWRRLTPVAV